MLSSLGDWKANAMSVTILCIGDVVGKPGRRVLADVLPELLRPYGLVVTVKCSETHAAPSRMALSSSILYACG